MCTVAWYLYMSHTILCLYIYEHYLSTTAYTTHNTSLETEMGFEPTIVGFAIRCLRPLSYSVYRLSLPYRIVVT